MTRARDLAAGTFELATGGVLKLETSDTTVTDGSVLGKIEFKAPDEASGTDANLTAAAIEAVAEGTFAADNNATELVFKTGASAAADAKMTLTSGGDLLVGKTSSSLSTAGAELRSGGAITGTVSGGVVAALNRLTNDGNILTFNKDGSTVGSIGSAPSDRLFIGNGDAGIRFVGDSNLVTPWRPDTNANSDNLLDLGNSTNRWKDLYLGGGVFLGGTGASNKLSDYEEGTWTPTLVMGAGTTSYSKQSAWYRKIGDVVFIAVNVVATNNSNAILSDLSSLPFTVGSNSGFYPGPAVSNAYSINLGSGGTVLGGYWKNAENKLRFHSYGNNTGQLTPLVSASTSFEIRMQGFYSV